MERSQFIYLGRGLSKADVDKDPVIWHSLQDPSLTEYCIFGRSYSKYGKDLYVQNLWILKVFILRYLKN